MILEAEKGVGFFIVLGCRDGGFVGARVCMCVCRVSAMFWFFFLRLMSIARYQGANANRNMSIAVIGGGIGPVDPLRKQ